MADRLLPPSATGLEVHIEQAMARYGEDREIPIDALWDPARCPAALLPWLAWALGVRRWDTTWDVAVQRAVVMASIDLHLKEGTRSAIETLLGSLGALYTIEIAPRPFTARINIWNQPQIAISIPALEALIDDVTRLTVSYRLRSSQGVQAGIGVGVWCKAITVVAFEAAA